MKKIYKLVNVLLIGLGTQAVAQCPTPTAIATPTTGCSNTTFSLNAVTPAGAVRWYTVPTCGVPTGTSLSGSDYTVTAANTTTYYAESFAPVTPGGSLSLGYTGCMQQITIPSSVSQITIIARGAQGGSSAFAGGLGGSAAGVLTVTPGQDIYIYVGGQGSITAGGFNGGGNGGGTPAATFGGGGGGATDIRISGTALSNRILVAAGGGGSGGSTTYNPQPGAGGAGAFCSSPLGYGGSGGGGCSSGGAGGCAGGTAPNYGTGGGGGGLNSGAPTAGSGGGVFGTAGTLGQGGNGGNFSNRNGGGGGGGGLYGGAGGQSGDGGCNGGGGGGSSFGDQNFLSSITFTGATNSGHGSVIILGISGGCTSATRTPVVVNVGTSPTVSISETNSIICAGNTSTLTGSGATSYTWSNNSNSTSIVVSPTVTTTYTLSGDNGGCPGFAVKTITVNPAPSLSVTGASSVCAGNTLNLSVNGADSYSWSTGSTSSSIAVTPTANSVYTVIGTFSATGCSSSVTKSVTLQSLPTLSVSGNSTLCAGMSGTLTITGTAGSYSWNTGSTNTTIVVSPTVNTNYIASGTNACGTSTTSFNVVVSPCTSLSELNAQKQVISIYPNPAKEKISIDFKNASVKNIRITDMSGRVLINQKSESEKAEILINNLSNGVHFIDVLSEGVTEKFKLIKQ